MQQPGNINLHLILTIFLGVGMVLFGVLAVLAYKDNTYIHRNLSTLESSAAANASTQQKHSDDVANLKANELPYRTYTADPVDGSFQMQFPKDWSLYVGENLSISTPLDIAADPNFVLYNLSNASNVTNTHAFHLQLLNQSVQSIIQNNYNAKIKSGALTSKSVQVSGITATELSGTIDNERHNGIVVILPTRDQTMMMWTDDAADYSSEFNAILASAKIYP